MTGDGKTGIPPHESQPQQKEGPDYARSLLVFNRPLSYVKSTYSKAGCAP